MPAEDEGETFPMVVDPCPIKTACESRPVNSIVTVFRLPTVVMLPDPNKAMYPDALGVTGLVPESGSIPPTDPGALCDKFIAPP